MLLLAGSYTLGSTAVSAVQFDGPLNGILKRFLRSRAAACRLGLILVVSQDALEMKDSNNTSRLLALLSSLF